MVMECASKVINVTKIANVACRRTSSGAAAA